MATVEMSEAEMVAVAMDLGERLGGEKELPRHEMEIIAFYHPEDETRVLVGNAIVKRVLRSEPDGRKAGELSAISTDEKYHMKAREEAGKELCEIIRKAGAWEKSYQIAMDARYPSATREIAASDFLDNSADAHYSAAVLGCLGISEELREEKGFRIVKEAMERGDRDLIEKMGAAKGLPPMLSLYVKSLLGNGSRPRFARESIEPPGPRGMFEGEKLPHKK